MSEGGHGHGGGERAGGPESDISAEAILKDLFEGVIGPLAIPVLKVLQLEEYGSDAGGATHH
jgi:hypothetical protein